MNELELLSIRKRLEATVEARHFLVEVVRQRVREFGTNARFSICLSDTDSPTWHKSDAEFVAAAHGDVSALLQEVERLRPRLLQAGEGHENRSVKIWPLELMPRERLGQIVRETWVAWARQQSNPKPHWLEDWKSLSEDMREVDRLIGEAVRTEVLRVVESFQRDPR